MRFKPTKLDQLAGYVSYGIFLTHIPVMNFFHINRDGHNRFFDGALDFVLVLLVATLISVLIFYFVEKPIIKLRHKFSNNFQKIF